jgi:hypothetical protein
MIGVAGNFAKDFGLAVCRVGIGWNRLVFAKAIEFAVLLSVDTGTRGKQESIDILYARCF